MDVKLLVAAKYLNHKERLVGLMLRPVAVATLVAAECCVTKKVVCNIERELTENERIILALDEIYLARANPIGLGSRSMSG